MLRVGFAYMAVWCGVYLAIFLPTEWAAGQLAVLGSEPPRFAFGCAQAAAQSAVSLVLQSVGLFVAGHSLRRPERVARTGACAGVVVGLLEAAFWWDFVRAAAAREDSAPSLSRVLAVEYCVGSLLASAVAGYVSGRLCRRPGAG